MVSNATLRAILCATLTVGLAAVSLHVSKSHAEGRIEPPLELLYAPGNQLVAVTLAEIAPGDRLVFTRGEVLGGAGQPPEQIDVRASAATIAQVKPGARYIIGYTNLRKDPRNPARTIIDPAGPVLLTSVGLEPALFHDTPATRELLKSSRTERGRESKRTFELLMQALTGPDTQLQNLAAGQIAQEPEIGERVHATERNVIEKVARDIRTPPDVRSTLLLSASTRPHVFGDWSQAAALDLVTTTPVGGYAVASPDPSGLVLTAFDILEGQSATLPVDALKRWLRSTNSSVVEQACLALRRQAPSMERPAITEALADPALPATTRMFLNDHLRRLDLMDARSKRQKEGTA